MPKKLIRKILKILLTLIIGLLIVGSIFQYTYDNRTAENYKPDGKLIKLDYGYMHYKFSGTGSYTFVLEAGLGENMFTWSKLEDSLSQMGRVFMYDRAGLGYSDKSQQPRTSYQIAKELNQLLEKANIPGPYILIGHSIGGIHQRSFAHLYPKDVVGLFLLDPSHEKMKVQNSKFNALEASYHFSLKYLSNTGIPFFIMPKFLHPINKTSKNIKTYGFETDAIETSFKEIQKTNMDVSHLPIYIIYANDSSKGASHKNLLQEWIDHSNSNIKKMVEYQKPHYIHITNPDIVINDLQKFVNALKTSSKK